MGARMAQRLEAPVAGVSRIVDRLLASGVPLRPGPVLAAAQRLAVEEAPLDPGAAVTAVREVIGLGVLEPLLADPAVSDVLVNGPDDVWVERDGTLRRTDVRFTGPEAVVAAVERVIAPLGLRLDRASPAVDARLPDGSRLHAVVPPVSIDGPVVAIRRFTRAVASLDELVEAGSIDAAGADVLRSAVAGRRNVLVSGGTGSGKTTLLNVLSDEIPEHERVVTVEDAAELRLGGHVVRLEARRPNAEGAGHVPLSELVRHALRLRPDRIVVGEVRGPEAMDMIQAMSTGHDGSMSTVHANGPEEALWRLESLALSAEFRLSDVTVRRQLGAAIDIVVQVERTRGRRLVRSIVDVTTDGVEEVWSCS
jgi:pilus assembly protein CpaF